MERRQNRERGKKGGGRDQQNKQSMKGRKAREFSVSTAVTFIMSRIEIDEEEFWKKVEKSLQECVEALLKPLLDQRDNKGTAIKNLGGEVLLEKFIPLWNDTYPAFPIKDDEKKEEDVLEKEDEDLIAAKITSLFEMNYVEISPELVDMLAEQYKKIMSWLEEGTVCVRWRFMKSEQKEIVRDRLLEAMCAVFIHLIGFDQVIDPERLQGLLNTSTIILHGSYLFGASTYQPKDIDVIILSKDCHCSTMHLPKLTRECEEENIKIGRQCSTLDVMAGIPLCTEHTLEDVNLEELLAREEENLRGYLSSISDEADAGKRYRKLVNCALILQYLLIKKGLEPSIQLQELIDAANRAIVRGGTKEATKALLDECWRVFHLFYKEK